MLNGRAFADDMFKSKFSLRPHHGIDEFADTFDFMEHNDNSLNLSSVVANRFRRVEHMNFAFEGFDEYFPVRIAKASVHELAQIDL